MGKSDNLVWIDLEMTGLDPDNCYIIEIATVITDSELTLLAEGPSLVVYNTETELESLSDWSQEHFSRSGLLDRVRASTIDVAAAEAQTLAFVKEWSDPRKSPLCGNSVHADRQFLWRHMRSLHDHLHYRNVDVSSIKEVLKRWHPNEYRPPRKAGNHQALADIHESVEELRYYREAFIAPRALPAEGAESSS